MKMGKVDWIAWMLVVVGALNWGFVGVSNLNLVESLFGSSAVTQVLYILVGLAGLYMVWMAVSKK
ncbi:DUF378 domain-containing protein [Candidatus Woesebacteria bacterium RIFOXYA1_FULL_40_18]|uniref:DUF378 domain-containing protein n=4 Tax=Candidatus Woeseibacteriota TaxID=1752722 RepID=A0A1F8CHD0_9BACT|nr:MAG: hypothetical protein UT72_C0010G0006 [Candidatus Woesebacteria bacterium GW2011_GWB1_40_101]OGM75672.1 MAG: DUF378 domain-containing protein [Candidatus Woesebacteria bacterium RIFOXYA1_FULL_40_18]OGM80948.1 MAG: DUF378 domain-containing protein [Candidatus Woesebacteria bacterium RIFOXYB1_FULL_40_26]OGM87949.1 MAG: DUF378 domain-containing protein [Candidatus Woesebacteria bacterium RIFOXYD1_FULL_40_21]